MLTKCDVNCQLQFNFRWDQMGFWGFGAPKPQTPGRFQLFIGALFRKWILIWLWMLEVMSTSLSTSWFSSDIWVCWFWSWYIVFSSLLPKSESVLGYGASLLVERFCTDFFGLTKLGPKSKILSSEDSICDWSGV